MPLITPSDLADIDAVYLSALPDTATVTNPVAPGQTATSFDVPCAVLKPTRSTRNGGSIQPIGKNVAWTLAMPRDTNVKTKATIVVTEANRFPATKVRHLQAGEIIRNAGNDPAIFVETIEVPA